MIDIFNEQSRRINKFYYVWLYYNSRSNSFSKMIIADRNTITKNKNV